MCYNVNHPTMVNGCDGDMPGTGPRTESDAHAESVAAGPPVTARDAGPPSGDTPEPTGETALPR
jgi:hypothetical protein